MSELNEKLATAREGFAKGDWQNEVNVRDFIQKTTPHMKATNPSAGATEATTKLWDTVMEGVNRKTALTRLLILTLPRFHHHLSRRGLYRERSGKIVGLQTEAPLKRAIIPFGGIKMVEGSCKAYNRELDPMLKNLHRVP